MRSILIAICLTLTAAGDSSSTACPAYECEGNACSVVTLVWEEEGQQFRAQNDSDRRVKVEVFTFAGSSAIVVEPRKAEPLKVKSFNGPYHADYE